MPKFYTTGIRLINQSKEICEKQFSSFGSKGGQISPLMHVPLFLLKLADDLALGLVYIIYWLCCTSAQWYENLKEGVTMTLPESETVDHPRQTQTSNKLD